MDDEKYLRALSVLEQIRDAIDEAVRTIEAHRGEHTQTI